MSHENEAFREEVKKEFQLERMILFSDAVFAIVITLMAIEIRLPEAAMNAGMPLSEAIKHVVPEVIAYAASFFFIGAIWYQHLRVFGVLKDYDKGLVVRNLALLFLIGLFPFSATVITHGRGSPYALVAYLCVIFACLLAQYVLQYYILVQRPTLRIGADITQNLVSLQRRKVMVISFGAALVSLLITLHFTTDLGTAMLATWWIALVPVSMRIFRTRAKKKAAATVSSASAPRPE